MKDTLYKGIDYQAVVSVDHSDDPQCIRGDCEDSTAFHFTINCLDCASAPEGMGWVSASDMEADSDYESPDATCSVDATEPSDCEMIDLHPG